MAATYDQTILDHIRNARNYRLLENADHEASGINPLCGDEVLVRLSMDAGRIGDVAFQCTCCGISMASASIMTTTVKGMSADDAKQTVEEFGAFLNVGAEPASKVRSAEWLALLDTIKKFPSRIGCAMLPWTTLERALDRVGPQ
jgi:nitrogen fixation protein NifU and related proteins